MRITKVKIGKDDVVIRRNTEEGYLQVGGAVKSRSSIHEFITTKKQSSIKLSLQNKMLVKNDINTDKLTSEEKLKVPTYQAVFKKIFASLINAKFTNSPENITIAIPEIDSKLIKYCLSVPLPKQKIKVILFICKSLKSCIV